MAIANQVQLRGGTTLEHNSFIGAHREITVDTDNYTLRVHDGVTLGGTPLSTQREVFNIYEEISARINNIETNIGQSHNHDDRYAGKWNPHITGGATIDNVRINTRDILINNKRALVGFGATDGNILHINFDNDYGSGVRISGTVDCPHNLYVKGRRPFLDYFRNGYYGLCNPDGNESEWIRTPANGLIPYQSGGYSSLGTASWRFNEGHFNTLNAHTINLSKNGHISRINFAPQLNDAGYIEHYENNNSSALRLCVSDDGTPEDEVQLGVTPGGVWTTNFASRGDGTAWFRSYIECQHFIVIGGRRLYIGQRPGDAPDGSVSIG